MDMPQYSYHRIREHRCDHYDTCRRQATFCADDGRYWCCTLCWGHFGGHTSVCPPPIVGNAPDGP